MLAAHFARGVRPAGAQRWLGSAGQDLRDCAVLWMRLARQPIRLTWDARIYAPSKPRLLAMLPTLGLPDPDGKLREFRLQIALARLRDTGHMWLEDKKRYGSAEKLLAAGDLPGALYAGDNALERFPWGLDGHINEVACARALGTALAGASVGLTNFATAFGRMLAVVERRTTPKLYTRTRLEACMFGLLPVCLYGEAQLGLRAGKPTAIRFMNAKAARATAMRALAEDLLALPHAAEIDEARTAGRFADDALDAERTRYAPHQWRRQEPVPLAVHADDFQHTPSPKDTLVSTIDARPNKLLPWREYREEERVQREQWRAKGEAGMKKPEIAVC